MLAIAKSVMHKDALKTKSSLFEQGLTSLGAVEIRTRIEDRFQITLRSSIVFDYPTLADLAAFTMNALGGDAAAAAAEPAAARAGHRALEEALVRDILRQQFGV
ncbi:hypothetical protein WS68_16080 [Burkholderia sp. TSV86]|nr:hypothetical protein WS68_16080 [Burkholderia sp. TSV86]